MKIIALLFSFFFLSAFNPAEVYGVVAGGQTIASGGGSSCATLSNEEFHLSAANTSSWDTGDTSWFNLTASPFSGASQSDYDFFLGTDATSETEDPTFTGTPGSAGAYFDFTRADGEYMELELGSTSTTFLKNLHQASNTQDWTLAVAIQSGISSSGQYYTFTNGFGSTSIQYGFQYHYRGNDTGRAQFKNDSDTETATTSNTVAENDDAVFILSYDVSENTLTIWMDDQTPEDFTVDPTNSDDPVLTPTIGGMGDGNNTFEGRIYGVKMYGEYMDDDKANQIIHDFEVEHNIDFDGSTTIGDCS